MTAVSNEELLALYFAEVDTQKKEDIREKFFRKNENFPHFVARKFKNLNISHEDLTGIASIGMVKAFNKFKMDAGVKFTTYAATIMNNEILMQFRKEKRHIGVVSIDSALTTDAEGNEFTLLNLLADDTCFELDVEQSELLREIREVASNILSEYENIVLLNALNGAPLTQKQLSEKLRVSQSYISRLSKSAIKKLAKYFTELKTIIEKEKGLKVLTELRIAKVGDLIEWTSKGRTLKGEVLNINERSVVVNQTINPGWKGLGLEEKTVVSHQKYKIIKDFKADIKGLSVSSMVIDEVEPNEEINIEPGSVENYHYLREKGHKDKAIRELWDGQDKSVKWHNARFYQFKQKYGLVAGKNNVPPVQNTSVEAQPEVVEEVQPPIQNELETEIDMLQEYWPDHPLFTGATEVESSSLQDEVLQLRNELMQMRNELWSERSTRLFAMQAQLDNLICESNGLQIADFESEHVLATIVELAEVAQEEQTFKYWKKQKTVDREKLIEELADVLHFIISRGVQLGFKRVAYSDDVERGKSVAEQMLNIIEQLLKSRKSNTPVDFYIELFNTFRVLVELMGYTWQEISDAYEKKHSENIARQNRKY